MSKTIGTPNGLVNRHTERPTGHYGAMGYDGSKIASLRIKKGLSMAELARRSGIKPPSLWALEHQVTKKPKADTLIAVANALGVNLREITKGKKGSEDLVADISDVFERLDNRNKQAILIAARALLDSQK